MRAVFHRLGAEPRAANEQEMTVVEFAERGGRDVMAKDLRRLIQERQRAADAAKAAGGAK